MNLHGCSLIAGNTVCPEGAPFRAFNPIVGESLEPDFFPASLEQIDAAVKLAAIAFGAFRRTDGSTRAALLEGIASEIEALGDDLLQRAHQETALPLARLQGERARTCGQLRLFAALVREGSWVDARIDPALPERKPLPRSDLRRMLVPIGPMAVFGASNFPLAFSVAGGDTASALAAGCTVVVKAHQAHPGTSELVGAAISRAVAKVGLPAGVFSLLQGHGAAIGQALVKHPELKAVAFTGSQTAGRALFDAAAAREQPIPVFAEMGSLNPTFLLPGALRGRGDAIAQGLVNSFTLGVGQFCTKPGLVFAVRGPDSEQFLEKLTGAVAAAAAGSMLSPGIRDTFLANRERVAHSPGIQELATSSAAVDPARAQARPSVAQMAAADFLRNPAVVEVFGPFTLLVWADAPDQLTECARKLDGQLTATVHGTPEDLRSHRDLLVHLETVAGRLVLNGYPTGVEVCPSMHHGGPYPATSDARFTSVGTAAIDRFARPVCYQDFPAELLPDALRNENPLKLLRLIDGQPTRDPLR